MADDLEAGGAQVHDQALEVLRFWLEETPADHRFAKDEALDAIIAGRFGAWRDAVLASGAADWTEDPADLLAAIVLIDQFSRNIHRGSPRAFEGDVLARRLTRLAIARGWDAGMTTVERQFVYLPLMHSEDADDQRDSVRLFTELGDAGDLKFAHAHAAVIERFGRFPSRNAALERISTPEEVDYLSRPGAGWWPARRCRVHPHSRC